MAVITPERIADLIADAPAWALLALTMPQERLRTDGQREVANHVYQALYRHIPTDAQIPLPL